MNRNAKIQKALAVTLCISSVAGNTIPVLASDTPKKDENIYVNLNQDGSVSQIHVVNEFDLDSDASIRDYGVYSSVKNLTSNE